ncbi:MAG: hypothetical protein CTY16_12540 [Methylobacter sp.]|nr:MAG: hypothetical protein CTY16_12540 [Methylobacter sp.]
MANNYNQATVEPNFPVLAVTPFERHLLGHYGFSHEFYKSDQGDTVYFFAKESLCDEVFDLEVSLVQENAQSGDPVAMRLLDYLQEHGSEQLDTFAADEFSWECLFQAILKKPACAALDDICVMGAYTCDKLRPGEFGGWVCRITREQVQYDGTYQAYERMKSESGKVFLDALDVVWQLANGNCLDQSHDPDEEGLDAEIAGECRRQRNALNVVGDYLANHPLAR